VRIFSSLRLKPLTAARWPACPRRLVQCGVCSGWQRQVVDLVWCCEDWSLCDCGEVQGHQYPIESSDAGVAGSAFRAESARRRGADACPRCGVTYETIRSWWCEVRAAYPAQFTSAGESGVGWPVDSMSSTTDQRHTLHACSGSRLLELWLPAILGRSRCRAVSRAARANVKPSGALNLVRLAYARGTTQSPEAAAWAHGQNASVSSPTIVSRVSPEATLGRCTLNRRSP